MRVAIGSDHAGYELKEAIKPFLVAEHHEVLDVGTASSEDPVDYSDFAGAVGAALHEHSAERGILMCGSGVGASMAANRLAGVRAAVCHDTYSAHQGVEHDDMNVLVLGGRVVGVELARELARAFLNARFSGEERHLRRLAKLMAMENPLRALQIFGQSVWLDYIRRSLITSGELQRLIDEDGLRGVTSNPSIFEKAIAGSSDYDDALESARRALARCEDALRAARRPRHPGGRRRAAPGVRADLEAGRVRQPGGVAAARDGHGGHARGGEAPLAGGAPRKPHDQGPGDAGGHLRRGAARRGGDQRQRHPAVRDGRVRADRRRVPLRAGAVRGERRRSVAASPASRASSSAGSTPRSRRSIEARLPAASIAGARPAAVALRKGGDRERARSPTSATRRSSPARAGRPSRPGERSRSGCSGPDRHEEPRLPRRPVRRGADRPGHGQHDPARHARRVPRSRPAARQPGRGRRLGPRHDGDRRRARDLDEGGDRRSCSRTGCASSRRRSRSC